MHKKPLIVEDQGVNKVVLAFSDIDGTVNNQNLAESERANSIDPAKHAFMELESLGIYVGLISGRSYAEVDLYNKLLDINGIGVSEDGGVILNNLEGLNQNIKNTINISDISISHLLNFISYIEEEFVENITNYQRGSFVNSLTSSRELICELFKHQDINYSGLSAQRLSSMYLYDSNLSEKQIEIFNNGLIKFNLRSFGRPIHVVSKNVDKGVGLDYINQNIINLIPLEFAGLNINNIIPIVFGNDINDIPLFQIANKLGGIGVLVKNPDTNDYLFNSSLIQSRVIKTNNAYGYGIQESLVAVKQFINNLRIIKT